MSNLITLTASMRSNLTSLSNISTQMSKIQNILSTGKKVNSAIDNASSYYQARSLTNRASDLNSLLDSMSQGIQTINAALEGLENATSYLTQAKAVLEEAAINQKFRHTAKNKEYLEMQDAVFTFTNRKGEVISSVVTNKEDLLDAVASGRSGEIIVFGEIDMGADKIVLNDNQSLVGVDKYSAGAKTQYSKLTFDVVGNAIEAGNNSTIGWLDISGKITKTNDTDYASMVFINGKQGIDLHDLDINLLGVGSNTTSDDARKDVDALEVVNGGKVNVFGNLNIKTTGYRNYAIFTKFNSELNFYDANVNILTTGQNSFSIVYESDAKINIYNKTNLFVKQNASYPIIRGKEGPTEETLFNILSSEASIFLKANVIFYPPSDGDTNISVVKGSKLYLNNILYEATKDETSMKIAGGNNPNSTTNGKNNVFSSRAVTTAEQEMFDNAMSKVMASDFPKNVNVNEIDEINALDNQIYIKQYSNIITQFDNLLADSSYQGVNLLTGGNLEVTFNESRTHGLTVKGKNMLSDNIGIKTKKWASKTDIKSALKEIDNAINTVRSYSAELGNNYTIIQTRQSFTEALSDILEVGADKLTLADMNETSAEYLMLQTRQQLAVNSLSLASQSAKSILSLF